MTPAARAPIHATNAWNPTGHTLAPVPGTRLYYVHATRLSGPSTFVLLGDQHHLTFVAEMTDHVAPDTLRQRMLNDFGLYPHQVDLPADASLPTPADDDPRSR
ncbi:MAG: hypothetical protein NVSMB2_16730 [Chloroflexota bacterium]